MENRRSYCNRQMCCLKTMELKQIVFMLYRIFLIVNLFFGLSISQHTWERPGCFKVGHERNVYIDGCVVFTVQTNACRGYCESCAYPSPNPTLQANPNHRITSRAECCSIQETHNVVRRVRCVNGRIRTLTFKSAKTCACSLCRRD